MPESFEWFTCFDSIKGLVHKYFPKKDSSILEIGCGTSQMAMQMLQDGYQRITAIDHSEVAIRLMKQQVGDMNGLECKFDVVVWKRCQHQSVMVMDAKCTDFPSWYFDYIMDKGCFEIGKWMV